MNRVRFIGVGHGPSIIHQRATYQLSEKFSQALLISANPIKFNRSIRPANVALNKPQRESDASMLIER